jgi:transketolase
MAKSLDELKKMSNEMRADILKMIHLGTSGHPGGSLSCIDILTVLFFNKIGRTKENALDPERHRFILSKGHGVPALYCILNRCGIIPTEELWSLRKLGSRLQGHPDRVLLPYVEASTGSLGQGLSIAEGMAIAAKTDKKNYKVYCMIGDGESQEGQIWEALLSAPKFKLDNLTVILDYNKGQIDGPTNEVLNLEPIKDKLLAFNWDVQVIDGHNFTEIQNALDKTDSLNGKPHFIIANTIKGKGVSFMEGVIDWHGKAPTAEQVEKATAELKNLN